MEFRAVPARLHDETDSRQHVHVYMCLFDQEAYHHLHGNNEVGSLELHVAQSSELVLT